MKVLVRGFAVAFEIKLHFARWCLFNWLATPLQRSRDPLYGGRDPLITPLDKQGART